MYKLLVTTALVAITATSASAWTGAKDLISDLDKVYSNLDGQAQFGELQGAGGELNTFVNNVATGVTHLSLNVDENNLITASVNEGTTLAVISDSVDDLVNRVNFDIFVQDAGSADPQIVGYDPAKDYTGIPKEIGLLPDVDAYDADTNKPGVGNLDGQYQPDDVYSRVDTNKGLLGTKIDTLVTDVNKINEGLLSTSTDATERDAFVANYAAGENSINGVDIGTFQTNIDQLNSVGQILGGSSTGINSELNGIVVDSANVNSFYIPSYNDFNDIGIEATKPGGYVSLSNWANGVQTVVTTAGSGTIATAGTITITDSAAGKIDIDGAGYTLNGGVFVAD